MESKITKRYRVVIVGILIGLLSLVLAPGRAGTSDPNSEEDIAVLQKQNQELRQQLEGYKSLDEERLAWKVFNKAKQHLTVYLAAGSFAFAAIGVIGIKSFIGYLKKLLEKKVAEIDVEKIGKEIKDALLKEGKQQIDSLADEVQEKLLVFAEQQQSRLLLTTEPIGPQEMAEKRSNFDNVLDYTEQMQPVRTQGREGSSVGFATAAALEYQIQKTSGKTVSISPRHIYYYARSKGAFPVRMDSGARLRDAVEVLMSRGAVAEEAWPYKAGEFANEPPDDIDKAKHFKIAESQVVRSVEDLKAALVKFGPVFGGFTIFGSLAHPGKNGRIQMPTAQDPVRGAHAVCFVGFDDNKRLIKFRNQWGQEWGDNGYGYLTYEYCAKFLTDVHAISMRKSSG